MSFAEKKTIACRWLRFLLGGGINTAFTYAIYIALNLAMGYQSAYLIAYLTGVVFAYCFNAVIVFRTPLSWKGFFSYPLVYLFQYGASAMLLGILVNIWRVSETLAPLIVTVGMIPLTYVLSMLVLRTFSGDDTHRVNNKERFVRCYQIFGRWLNIGYSALVGNNITGNIFMENRNPHLNTLQINDDKFVTVSDRTCQTILAVTYCVVVIAWSSVINFNGAPDESTHFFLVEYLREFKTMPAPAGPLITFTGPLSHYSWHPGSFWYYGLPFPHVVGALFTASIGSIVLPEPFLYMGVRAFNWVLAALFVVALFRIARRVGLSQSTSVISVIIVAMIPQVSFVFAYFNSDAYGIVSVAWALSSLLAYCASPTRMRSIVLGITIGLLMLAKLYFLPGLVFLGATLVIRSSAGLIKSPRHYLEMTTSCLIFAAPMFVFTYSHFGEIFGISGQLDFVKMHKLNPNALYGTCYYLCEQGLIVWSNLLPWLESTAKSYFSVTGWMSVLIPDNYYWTALLLILILMVSALLLAIYDWQIEKRFSCDYHLPLIMILGLFPSITIFSIIASQNGLPQAQGRYLFVTIPFLAYLIVLVIKKIEDVLNNIKFSK
ncbi:MAG TPA: GtrA family protein [Methylobacter sp.]|jgi:putative flippase GtrA